MSEKKEVKQWITVNGVHVPIFDGESKADAINRAIARKNESIKAKQIAQRKAEIAKLNPDKEAMSAKDKAYAKTAWEYFKNLDPDLLDDYAKQLKGNKIALEQIRRARRRNLVLQYYSNVPADTIEYYTKEANKLSGDEKEWALEGLKNNKNRKK